MAYDVYVVHWEDKSSEISEHSMICAYENEADALDVCEMLEKHGDDNRHYYVDTLQVKE